MLLELYRIVLARYYFCNDLSGNGLRRKLLMAYTSQVTVLESQDRLGGRIHTDFSSGFPVDMVMEYYMFAMYLFLFFT